MAEVLPFDFDREGIDSEVCFRNVFARSPIGIALVAPDGRWLRVNSALCEVVGYTADELLAITFQHITYPDDLQADLDLVAQTLRGECDTYELEKRYFHKDGRVIWVLLDVTLIRHAASGQPLYFISQIQDITARKQTEEALVHAKAEADLANAAKSEFLSRISHELRTPLHAILGFGQLLESDKASLSGQQADGVDHILAAGRRLLMLVDEVLDISRVQSGQVPVYLEQVALDEIAQDALAPVRPLAAQFGVALLQCPTNGQISLRTDRAHLKEALVHLLSNAVKYNRPGGTATLQWRRQPGNLRIEVIDTGMGIASADIQRIFQPFSRGPGTEHIEGLGLGLYLAKSLLQPLGGTLSVSSEPGRGSTFSIDLPV